MTRHGRNLPPEGGRRRQGFTPLVLPEGYDYYAMFHGAGERIPLSALESGVRIMDQFLTTAAP